jgi:hypothetical protein
MLFYFKMQRDYLAIAAYIHSLRIVHTNDANMINLRSVKVLRQSVDEKVKFAVGAFKFSMIHASALLRKH